MCVCVEELKFLNTPSYSLQNVDPKNQDKRKRHKIALECPVGEFPNLRPIGHDLQSLDLAPSGVSKIEKQS